MAIRNHNFQRIMKLHRWLGVFLSLHVVLLAVTGVILVFRHELSEHAPVQTLAAQPVMLQSLVDESLKAHPRDRILAIAVDHDDPQTFTLRLGKDGSPKFRGARRLVFDQRDGRLKTPDTPPEGFLHSILVLHRELFLGTPGKLYVGVLGLLYAFVLVSGFVLYGPMMRRLSFAQLRTHLHPRVFWSDLHKYMGAVTFAWALVVALSGFLLGWGGPLLKLYQATVLSTVKSAEHAGADAVRWVSVDKALATARQARPEWNFSFVSFPGSEFATAHHFIFVMEGPTPLTESLSDLVLVDAATGDLSEVLSPPWYLKLLLLAEPLHFGDYGGLPLKILWVILGLMSLILPLSGLRMLMQRLNKAYFWPVVIMVLSWTGIFVALGVEGAGDGIAVGLLFATLLSAIAMAFKSSRA